jgi:hypothetical protein
MLGKSLGKAPEAGKMKNRSNYNRTKSNYQQSAPFQIPTKVLYQPDGKRNLETSETQCISRSGVLFNVSKLLAVNTPLGLRIAIATEIGSEAGTILLRHGHIVRTILPPISNQLSLMVATFSDLLMLPGGCEPPEDC